MKIHVLPHGELSVHHFKTYSEALLQFPLLDHFGYFYTVESEHKKLFLEYGSNMPVLNYEHTSEVMKLLLMIHHSDLDFDLMIRIWMPQLFYEKWQLIPKI